MDHLPVDDPARADDHAGAIQALIDASTEVNRYVGALEAQLRLRTRALWGAIIASALVVAVALAVGYSVVLDNRAQVAESNARWCPLVALILPQPGEELASERGRRIAQEMRALYESFGCRNS